MLRKSYSLLQGGQLRLTGVIYSDFLLNLMHVTPPSLLAPTKGIFNELFSWHKCCMFWIFKYMLGFWL